MTRRLSATEKLARDICWAGFNDTKSIKKTKNQYWEGVSTDARRDYVEHAAKMIWWTRRLGADRLADAVAEYDAKRSGDA